MQRKLLFLLLLVTISVVKTFGQKAEFIYEYINAYKEIAMNEMKRTGVPAAIKLAQGIHETEAGRSELVTKSNNHFGIKCKTGWAGNKVYHDDDAEGECFRSYEKAEDSYMDHSNFLRNSQRYAFLFDLDPTDYKAWAYGLKKAGYATNIKYSQILIRIIETYNLEQYTLIAMGRMKESDEILVKNDKVEATPILTNAVITEQPLAGPKRPEPNYPLGTFTLNNTRVIYAKSGTSWLSIAEEYNVPLSRLLDFNDLINDDDVLVNGQLVFLQRKRKVGANEFHVVAEGETLYDICQLEGLRLESMMAYNHLVNNMMPVVGEKLYLHNDAPARPALISEKKVVMEETISAPAKISEAAITHTVQTKETLYSISKKYSVTSEQLKEWNKLGSYELKVGQQLVIYRN